MKYAFFASGFREKRGEHTGTKSNADKVRDEYQSNDCTVTYCEYNDDPEQYAFDLATRWKQGDVLIVVAYSWGCGKWARKFLWRLFQLNPSIRVSKLILVDPVIYTEFFTLRWWAITDWGTITFPDNIDGCIVFFQRIDEPNASNLKFKGRVLPMRSELDYKHTKIDNAPEVTEMVMEMASVYLS